MSEPTPAPASAAPGSPNPQTVYLYPSHPAGHGSGVGATTEFVSTNPLTDPGHPLHGWDSTITPVLAALSVPLIAWRVLVYYGRAAAALKGSNR